MARAAAFLLFALASCGESRQSPAPGAPVAELRQGIRFDPRTLRPGDRVGTLLVDTVVTRTALDSSQVGSARFRGEVELGGQIIPHFDSEAPQTVCFEADSASAGLLPRWQGDERRSWFCFTNQEAAREAFGSPRGAGAARIVVDRFTIHRGLSDEVNEAMLVRVLQGGGRASSP